MYPSSCLLLPPRSQDLRLSLNNLAVLHLNLVRKAKARRRNLPPGLSVLLDLRSHLPLNADAKLVPILRPLPPICLRKN